MADHRALVELEFRDAKAGVVRDHDGRPCLGVWPVAGEPLPLTVLDGWVPVQIERSNDVAIGGPLPEAATAVEVRGRDGTWRAGAVDEGYWVAWAPGAAGGRDLPPYRFRQPDGDLVRVPPSPSAIPLTATPPPRPLVEACPACDSKNWFSDATVLGAARIICGRCGYTHGGVRGAYGIDSTD